MATNVDPEPEQPFPSTLTQRSPFPDRENCHSKGEQYTDQAASLEPQATPDSTSHPLQERPDTGSPLPTFSPSQWALVLLLAAINFTHILDFVIVMPLGDQLRDELQINPRQFGLIVSAYGLTAMLAGISAAMVIDRFDRKTVMLFAFAGFTLSTIYCGLSPDYRNLLIARGLAGICGGIVASSIMSFIGDVIPFQLRGRALGVVTSSFAVASVLGLPIGLFLANTFHHFSAPFLAISGLAICVWLLAFLHLPSLRGHLQNSNGKPARHEFLSVIKQSNHQVSFAFMLCMVLATFLIAPFIATYMEANCGVARAALPWLYAVAGISSLVFMNLSGWLTDRFGARPIFLVCAGTAVLMSLVITNLPVVATWLAITVTATFITFASSRVVPAQAMMIRCADPQVRGAFMSLNSAVSHFATAIAPAISGAIIGEEFHGGPLTQFWIIGLIAALFGVLAMYLSFQLHPPKPSTSPTH